MRALIVDRGPRFQTPPEHLLALWDEFAQWRNRWREKMESFQFFVAGWGGFAVVDVTDETELQKMILEYPFSSFSELDVRPIMDGDEALKLWRATLQQREDMFG